MEDSDLQENLGIDRRTLLKRSAVVGGTLVWAAPLVQTLAKPAFAAPRASGCNPNVKTCSDGTTGCHCYNCTGEPAACCACIATNGFACFIPVPFGGFGQCDFSKCTSVSC